MCQMNVIIDNNGNRKTVLEEVTRLEITPAGVKLSTFFDEPKTVDNVRIKEIDFLGNTVTLTPSKK